MQAAAHNSTVDFGRGKMLGALWRSNAQLVGAADEAANRTLPVIDPEHDNLPGYKQQAQTARNAYAVIYLNQWNSITMAGFDALAKMCQFAPLWRYFTCGQLQKLLAEYPDRNLPMMIRSDPRQSPTGDPNQELAQYYSFVGVVYWRKTPELTAWLFQNPMQPDAQTYAAVHMFIPRPRLVWWRYGGSSGGGQNSVSLGGMLNSSSLTWGNNTGTSSPGSWWVVRGYVPNGSPGNLISMPTSWDLWNQSWNCQLAPATQPSLATILQTEPPLPAFSGQNLVMPNLGSLTSEDIQKISPH
jgi:hypothetical protein